MYVCLKYKFSVSDKDFNWESQWKRPMPFILLLVIFFQLHCSTFHSGGHIRGRLPFETIQYPNPKNGASYRNEVVLAMQMDRRHASCQESSDVLEQNSTTNHAKEDFWGIWQKWRVHCFGLFVFFWHVLLVPVGCLAPSLGWFVWRLVCNIASSSSRKFLS